MSSSDIAISVRGLGKSYTIARDRQQKHVTLAESLLHSIRNVLVPLRCPNDTFWALNDVSFDINKGEVVGIIGRNGAGKSTLLKVLSRITEPTMGEIDLYGRVGSLLEVGTGFHPELSGRENIYLNGAILGMTRSEVRKKFDEIVAFAEVEKFLDTPVKRYSSGMYVRLAFAVAAHLDPEILIVDEVLAVGDATFQKKCMGKMSDVARQGRTVIFVSHNLAAVEALCSRGLLLHAGTLLKDDTSENVVRAYASQGRVSRAEILWPEQDPVHTNRISKLQGVRVRDHGDKVSSEIGSGEGVTVEIDYLNYVRGLKLGSSIVLTNQDGVCVFSSISNHDAMHQTARVCGLYRSRCAIPPDLLSEGLYTVTVVLWTDGYTLIHREDSAVEFHVIENGDLRGDYFGSWQGVIRPRLQWETSLIMDSNLQINL